MSSLSNIDTKQVDVAMLEETKQILQASFSVMIIEYLEDCDDYIKTIKKGVLSLDKALIMSAAHPLKSSSASMGMSGLSSIASSIEDLSRSNGEPDPVCYEVEKLLPSLNEAFKYAKDYLNTFECDG